MAVAVGSSQFGFSVHGPGSSSTSRMSRAQRPLEQAYRRRYTHTGLVRIRVWLVPANPCLRNHFTTRTATASSSWHSSSLCNAWAGENRSASLSRSTNTLSNMQTCRCRCRLRLARRYSAAFPSCISTCRWAYRFKFTISSP